MISIAYVKGLRLARICNHDGINTNGAKAVLENSRGKLIIKIHASNSIWPGKINASIKLILVTLLLSKNRMPITIV